MWSLKEGCLVDLMFGHLPGSMSPLDRHYLYGLHGCFSVPH